MKKKIIITYIHKVIQNLVMIVKNLVQMIKMIIKKIATKIYKNNIILRFNIIKKIFTNN